MDILPQNIASYRHLGITDNCLDSSDTARFIINPLIRVIRVIRGKTKSSRTMRIYTTTIRIPTTSEAANN